MKQICCLSSQILRPLKGRRETRGLIGKGVKREMKSRTRGRGLEGEIDLALAEGGVWLKSDLWRA